MIRATTIGAREISELLKTIAPRHAINITRATVNGIAGEIRDEAKPAAPRDRGILRRAIKVKRRRMSFGKIRSDVVVERGTASRSDGFYWRFIEFGTRLLPARPFFLPAVRRIEARLPEILREQFTKKFVAAVKRARRRSGG